MRCTVAYCRSDAEQWYVMLAHGGAEQCVANAKRRSVEQMYSNEEQRQGTVGY